MPVEFEIDINVENINSSDYRNFIEDLRRRLTVRYCHNCPVLALQENPPTRFFDLVLRTNNHSVRFRFRMDNLYMIGYQMENGQWLEFDAANGAHLIQEPGTTFLNLGVNYDGLERAAGRTMENIGVGSRNLSDGINHLATSTERATRARYLIVVVMMICESSRFIPIFNYVAPTFDDATHGIRRVEPWIRTLVTSWADFSGAMLHSDVDPVLPPPENPAGPPFEYPAGHPQCIIRTNQVRIPPDTTIEIRSIRQVAEILGILLGLCYTSNTRRPRRMATFDNEVGECLCFEGLPLVQVFSVRIDNIIEEDRGELYGTITINDGLNTEYLYNRTSSNREYIKPGQNVSLIGPCQSVLAIGYFTIKLLLTDKDPLSWDDIGIINKDISWDALADQIVYDKPIFQKLVSNEGSVMVNYAVLRNAAAARIAIILEQGGETKTNVYGKVDARYDNWKEDSNTTCLLFNRSSDDYADVRRRYNIPLSRSVVAVPLDASLIVTATLYNYDTTFPREDEIAKGTVEFPAEMSATRSKQIQGKDGNWVTVIVYWTCQI